MSKDVLFIITNVFLKYVIILSSIKRELWNMHIHLVRERKQVYCPWRQQLFKETEPSEIVAFKEDKIFAIIAWLVTYLVFFYSEENLSLWQYRFFMTNKEELSFFEINVATRISLEVFRVSKQNRMPPVNSFDEYLFVKSKKRYFSKTLISKKLFSA